MIIYVGVVNSNKNIETIIKACEILIEQGYEVCYTVMGKIVENKYHDLMKINEKIFFYKLYTLL